MTRSLFAIAFAILLSTSLSAATVTVTTTADDLTPNDGSVSLREAMTAMNAGNTLGDPDIAAQNPTATNPFGTSDTIAFAIPGAGVHTITLSSPLPDVTATMIDGYSQPGAAPNTLPVADDAVIEVVIDGNGVVPNDLQISGNRSVVRGLSMIGFTNAAVEIMRGSANDVVGNFIGVQADGLTEDAGPVGVSVGTGGTADENSIGAGNTPANRNLIAGVQASVLVATSSALANSISGNLIGTDRTGMKALPSLGIGVHVISTDVTYIGAVQGIAVPSCTGDCNVIVAGDQPAIEAEGLNFTNQLAFIQSNFIGTNATGTAALGGNDEILLKGPADPVFIGFNLISGGRNQGAGIRAINGVLDLNVVNNIIGTDASGTLGVGNSGPGIFISDVNGAFITKNVISGNGAAGVVVQSGTGNAIQTNSISRNGGIGIDLGGDGPTANDACDGDSGANNLQNTPVITAVQTAPAPLISGTLNSAPNTTYRIEFFSTPLSGGFEQGQTYLGFTSVHTAADCTATFSFQPPSLPVASVITATATDPAGNTSEFSAPALVAPPTGIPALSNVAMLLLALALAITALWGEGI